MYIYRLALSGLGINLNVELDKSGEKRVFKNLLKNISEPVVFDVGANIGEYSEMARKTIPNAKIYSFEPHPITFKKLEERGKKFNLNVFNLGFGNFKQETEIFDYATDDSSPRASLFKDVIEKQYNSNSISHKVKILTIDEFTKEHNINKIDFLKIDVEGNELNVLRGASNLIIENKVKIIQFEFNYTNIISRTFLSDFFDELTNYTMYRVLRNGMVKINYMAINEIFQYQNIIALNNEFFKEKIV